MNTIVASAHEHAEEAAPFLEEYLSLLTDPAHLAFELTLMFVIDLLIGVIVWPRLKGVVIRRHDARCHVGDEHCDDEC